MKKIKEFHILRHPEVDKKHPLGEAAPLTDNGREQVAKLIQKFKEFGIGLVVVSAEDIPRFSDTTVAIEAAGFSVRRADNICFKDMKGKAPILDIIKQYREGGMALVRKLSEDNTTPAKIAIIGSWPLVSGMGLTDDDFDRMQENWFDQRPDFCTGLIYSIYDNIVSAARQSNIGIINHYNPLAEDVDDDWI